MAEIKVINNITPTPINLKNLNKDTILDEAIFKTLMELKDPVVKARSKYLVEERARELKVKSTFDELYKAYEKKYTMAVSKPPKNIASKKILPIYILQNKDSNGNVTGEYVSPPRLAAFFRLNANYIFVRNNATESILRYFYNKKRGVYELVSDDQLKGFLKNYVVEYNLDLLRMKDINEAFQDLITDNVFHDIEELNNNEYLINFENGMLNLRTLELTAHSPIYLSTIQIPCKWTGKASATPTYDKYMNTLCNNNQQVKDILEQFLGLAISNLPGWKTKKALLLVGKGDTGKTQLRSLAEKLVGLKNCASIDLEKLEGNRFAVATAFNKRIVGSADMSYISVKELGEFKRLTGGDPVSAEFKGKTPFDFIYKGIMWYNANKAPRFGGDKGDWVYNRWLIIQCNNVVPPEERDPHLLDKLFEEREGIVYQALLQVKALLDNNYKFVIPDVCLDALKEYKIENNPTIAFIEECMKKRVPNTKTKDTIKRIYDVYKAWCKDNNYRPEGKQHFITSIAQYLNYDDREDAKDKYGKLFFKDLELTAEAVNNYNAAYNNTYVRALPGEK